MQDPNESEDVNIVKKLNDALGNSGSTRCFQPVLRFSPRYIQSDHVADSSIPTESPSLLDPSAAVNPAATSRERDRFVT